MNDVFGLAGRAAIVWGGGQGMGERTAIWLAEAGCDVAVVDIVTDLAEQVAEQVRALGRRAVALTANITIEDEVDQAVRDAEAAIGGLTIMATVVGMTGYRRIVDTPVDQWEREYALNLKGFFLTSRAVARAMIAGGRGGAITSVCSVSGLVSAPNHAIYGAAKAGMINLVRSLAVELGPDIRVNAVAPGGIHTVRVQPTPERIAAIRRRVPLQRLGTTDEIAKAILFLSSDLASFVTGQTLPVDGGWSAAFLLDEQDLLADRSDKNVDWDAVTQKPADKVE
jgi:NAD(P)-dependent dehydrogenase (short-subunit alcohol dehydrogenase family)